MNLMRFRRAGRSVAASVAGLAMGLAAAGAQAQGHYGYGRGHYGDGWSGSGHMLFGGFGMILLLVIVVAVIVLLVRWLGPGAHPSAGAHYGPPAKTALDILKERFARGEIDKDEFEDRRRTLGE